MRVKVKVPFYSTELGTAKVDDILVVASATGLEGLVEVLPETDEDRPKPYVKPEKTSKPKATKKAKQSE